MFTSKHYLHQKLGVDFEIAEFFVDRKVPKDNAYWRGRYLYVAGGTGYMFIPLFFDLKYKIGVSKELILSPAYLEVSESILHSAALHEFEEISFKEHIQNCHSILEGKVANASLYEDLSTYFSNETLVPYKNLGTFSRALNRGDSFLFALCTLKLPDTISEQIIKQWYALVPSFLLMDDITDLEEDKLNGSENCVSDFGEGVSGVEKALEFYREKCREIKSVNKLLGEYFEESLEKRLQTTYFQFILKPTHGS